MNLNVLLLAKYLPPDKSDQSKIDYVREHELYHYELYESLSKICTVIPSRDLSDIERLRDEIDFVFPVFNNAGFVGAESFPATQCERFGIPYLGARPAVRGVAEDKHLGKILASHANINTPSWVTLSNPKNVPKSLLEDIEPPYFIKPRYGRNSEGITKNSIQYSYEGVLLRIDEMKNATPDLLIEHKAEGVYCTVPAWMVHEELEILPPIIQTVSDGSPVSSSHKAHLASGLVRSASDDDDLNLLASQAVRSMYNLMQPLDFARFDFIYDSSSRELSFLEVNVCCSLSRRSTFFMSANYAHGITYDKFVEIILFNSFSRQNA